MLEEADREVEGDSGEVATEAEGGGEAEATELGDTEQDGGNDGLTLIMALMMIANNNNNAYNHDNTNVLLVIQYMIVQGLVYTNVFDLIKCLTK